MKRYLGEAATADVLFGEDGKPIEEHCFEGEGFGENVIVVDT